MPRRSAAADHCEQAAAKAGVPERQRAIDRVRDAVGAEDLLEQRRVAPGIAEHHGNVARHHAVAQQLEHARGRELHLGSLAAGGVEGDGTAGLHAGGGLVLEQQPLQVMEGGARLTRVVIVERGQLELSRAQAEQCLVRGGHGLERQPSALVWQRNGHVRVAPVRDRVQGS